MPFMAGSHVVKIHTSFSFSNILMLRLHARHMHNMQNNLLRFFSDDILTRMLE